MKNKSLQLMILGVFWLPLTMGNSQAIDKCQDKLTECYTPNPEAPHSPPYCDVYKDSEDALMACRNSAKHHHSAPVACISGCRKFWDEDHCGGPCVLGKDEKNKKAQE